MIFWDWEPSVVIGCAALAAGYIAIARKRGLHRAPYFLGGVLLLLLDLVSPIDTLGDRFLFSAHAVQHFLLALVIPPLFLLGITLTVIMGIFSPEVIREYQQFEFRRLAAEIFRRS